MRRGLILFVGILALALAPAMVCAQYSGAFGLSGLPSMPSFFGGSSNCGGNAAPSIAPAVYFGWGIPQERNTSVTLSAQNNGANNIRSISLKLPTGGFWLGGALPISLTESTSQCGSSCGLSFIATGWYLFSGGNGLNSGQDYRVGTGTDGDITYTQYSDGNTWGAQPVWWFADAAVAYGCSGFAALLGLRYDYYTVTITGPNAGSGRLFSGDEQGNVIYKAWIPFIGFQSAYTDTVQSLKVRILGIPTILGTGYVGLTSSPQQQFNGRFEYSDTNYTSGGFFEAFGEYTRKFFGSSQAGVFARWNYAKAYSQNTGSFINNPAQQDTYDFNLNRSSWTLGGLVTLDFNTPF